jgi:hypothetical protein
MNKIKFFQHLLLLSFIIIAGTASFSQDKKKYEAGLVICKERASKWLIEKANADFGDPVDNMRKALKISKLEIYHSQIAYADRCLQKSNELPKDYDSVINRIFASYKKYVPDLSEDFYGKTRSELKESMN